MELNKYIDHTLLKPDATKDQIEKLCKEANDYNFSSACMAPCWQHFARPLLQKSTNLCLVQNFPHGNNNNVDGISLDWADEIDYVINIGFVKSGLWEALEYDTKQMRETSSSDTVVKVIVEVGYLTDEELFKTADILIKYNIDFIKTCTGYGPRNVTVDDIKKIKAHVGDRIRIKASGGIKTRAFAEDLIASGADRLGTSSGILIMENKISGSDY